MQKESFVLYSELLFFANEMNCHYYKQLDSGELDDYDLKMPVSSWFFNNLFIAFVFFYDYKVCFPFLFLIINEGSTSPVPE